MDVSIIIVNFNTKYFIDQCIDSIYKFTKNLIFEILVVDNASSDFSPELIKTKYPNVFLIESEINLGFGKANNFAAEKATGKYLFFLNSDTILLNNAVKVFYDFFETAKRNYRIGAIGGILLNDKRLPTHSYNNFLSPIRIIKHTLLNFVLFNKGNPTGIDNLCNDSGFFQVDYITGADLFIPRNIFKQIGGFDPDYFMYFEEADLQLRLKKLGYSRLIIDSTEIVHLEGKSYNKMSNSKRIQFENSKFIFLKKNYNLLSYTCFVIFYLLIKLFVLFNFRFKFYENVIYYKNIVYFSFKYLV